MKKVVVVIGEQSVLFEGENLQAINKKMGTPVVTEQRSEYFLLEILVIKDGDEEMGVFQKWDYWKKLE